VALGVCMCSVDLRVTSFLGGSHLASVSRGWPWGVRSSLGSYRWPCVFANGLVAHGWLLGVAVDLWGSRVTQITCQIFTNAPNFRIKKMTEAAELPSLFEVDRKQSVSLNIKHYFM
jgi:hypothetical protein